ncbi:MAG: serpin family protein, partial [Hadesarchaea archaeon]|nr:serpin family protein [Hadesarchaea archaeon]
IKTIGKICLPVAAALLVVFIVAIPGNIKPNDSGATPQTVAEVVGGNNKFAFDLYSQLAKNNEKNVFFSPWSIYTALAMTYEGARGRTAEEMESVLHLPEDDDVRRPSFAWIHNRLNENEEYELESANALWAQEGHSFLDSYFGIIENYYGGEIANLDFENGAEEARKAINDWVSEKTGGRIEELIEEGMLTPLTRLVLTNAIYFKGEWAKQFDEDATRPENFWVGPGRTVEVPMMSLTGEFNYTETEEFEALEMPYEGGDLSMLILLPKTRFGLSDLEKDIGPSLLNEIRGGLREQTVDVYMPRFELRTDYELSDALKEMGMASAFSGGIADFSGMDGTRDLFMDLVAHQAFVRVDEGGTEATAATGVVVILGIHKTFRADHPFLFIIQQTETGNILFMGRVIDPSEQR